MPAGGTKDYPWTVVLVMDRRPTCAFSGGYWQERLL
jgi:hypothetical protein